MKEGIVIIGAGRSGLSCTLIKEIDNVLLENKIEKSNPFEQEPIMIHRITMQPLIVDMPNRGIIPPKYLKSKRSKNRR